MGDVLSFSLPIFLILLQETYNAFIIYKTVLETYSPYQKGLW